MNASLLNLIICLSTVIKFLNSLEFEYHNYTQITAILQNYSTTYPNKTYLYSIGKSVQGRELWVLAISNTEPTKSVLLRPEAKYIGNMHGNEVTSKEILLHLIDYLLTSTDSNVSYLLNNTRVHILVSMNPDGYEISSVGDCDGLVGRYNSEGYDLNRNFPDLFECNPAPLQIETLSVINWLNGNKFILSANFHSGSVVVNYPYDNYPGASISQEAKENICDDNDLFKYMAKTYSFNSLNMTSDPCEEGFIDGITNGAAWYPVIGGMQDYNYWMFGCYEVTVEVSCCKFPPPSQLQSVWLDQKNALIEYLKLANSGVKGIIQFYNGQPGANISVQINSIEPIFKTYDTGEYYRILLPGNYTLKLLLDCVQIYSTTFTISNTTLLTVLNITLNQTQYNQYIQVNGTLNRFSRFCTPSRQPIQCAQISTDGVTQTTIRFTNLTSTRPNKANSLSFNIGLTLAYLLFVQIISILKL